VTIIINEGPAKLRAWNGLRTAGALVGEGFKVRVFLMDDGVYLAKTGQDPIPGLAALNSEEHLQKLMELGVEISCCGLCFHARGLSREEILPNIPIASLPDLAKAIKASRHVLTF